MKLEACWLLAVLISFQSAAGAFAVTAVEGDLRATVSFVYPCGCWCLCRELCHAVQATVRLRARSKEHTDSSWEKICWMPQDKMPGYLTRTSACLQKEDREPAVGNLLLFDKLALDHARTVVFTVCAKQSGEMQASRMRLLKINCFMARHV